MASPFLAALSGFFLALSLIVAIGAQNAFILRQGLLRQHVFLLCLICAICDAVLIIIGVLGFGSLIGQTDWLIKAVTYGGSAFLFVYGFLAFRRALSPDAMKASEKGADTLIKTVLTCLALTLLNPHVYLDTMILVGGLSAKYEGGDRIAYGVGAVMASSVWFFALGYGARLLIGIFQNSKAWQILDVLIGLVMWAIAISLLFS